MKKLALVLSGVLMCVNLVGCNKTAVNIAQTTQIETVRESQIPQEEKGQQANQEVKKEEAKAMQKDQGLEEKQVSQGDKDTYKQLILNETDTTVTFIDGAGNEKTLTKNPERTVVLLNSILDLWYLVGGEAVARVSGESNVPKEAMDITDLGSFNKVSIEALLALNPDLVIMHTSNSQTQFADLLDQNHVEWVVIDASTKAYEAFQNNAYIFSKILETEEVFDEKVLPVVEKCENIIEKANKKQEHPSVAVLYTTSKEIKVDTDESSIGELTSLLGVENIVKPQDIVVEGETRVAFSFEKLIESDPDYILISTMGDVEGAKEKIAKELESNPAWTSLKAVQNNEVHYLPKDLFVYKPNARYEEAFSYLSDIFFKVDVK